MPTSHSRCPNQVENEGSNFNLKSGSPFNCYWPMPFHKKARITMENIDDKDMGLYYQINYMLAAVPKDAEYFHAQFRHEYPLKTKGLYTILDGVKGEGQYVGTVVIFRSTVTFLPSLTGIKKSRIKISPDCLPGMNSIGLKEAGVVVSPNFRIVARILFQLRSI